MSGPWGSWAVYPGNCSLTFRWARSSGVRVPYLRIVFRSGCPGPGVLAGLNQTIPVRARASRRASSPRRRGRGGDPAPS